MEISCENNTFHRSALQSVPGKHKTWALRSASVWPEYRTYPKYKHTPHNTDFEHAFRFFHNVLQVHIYFFFKQADELFLLEIQGGAGTVNL